MSGSEWLWFGGMFLLASAVGAAWNPRLKLRWWQSLTLCLAALVAFAVALGMRPNR